MSGGREAVGRYQVRAELGVGGFATVYRGFDPVLGREVALKVLHPHLARDAEFRERFVREGRALARVRHSNVVQVHDAGEVDGTAFLAMEFVEGRPLNDLLARGPLRFVDVLAVARQIAPALAAVHAAGLLHRDIKPANIIVTPGPDGAAIGRAVLLDLGIAREMGAAGLTATGSVLGTPGYLAPEQAGPGQPSVATDVYQFAATLYALLTSRAPFEGDTARVLWALLHQAPPALASIRADVPPPAAAAIMQALAKDPAARPADPQAILTAMETLVPAPPVPATPIPVSPADAATLLSSPRPPAPAPPPLPPPPPPADGEVRGRRPLLVVGGFAAAGAVIVALVIILTSRGDRAEAGRPRPRATAATASATAAATATRATASATAAATATRAVTPSSRLSLPTQPAEHLAVPDDLSLQERELLNLINRAAAIYGVAMLVAEPKPLESVYTGEALRQYSATADDLKRQGRYQLALLVSISLTELTLDGPDAATARTKERWRTTTNARSSGDKILGLETEYSEFYRFVRRDGRWLISENTFQIITRTNY